MEQAVHQAAIHQALMGGVGVAQQRQRAALGDDRLPLGGDFVERLTPGDRRELTRALGAGAPERRLDALWGVYEVGVAVDLSAGKPRRVRMVRIALHAHDPAVLDMGNERAHVGTIVRTDHSNGRLHHTVSPKMENGV
jgi:hypothetical protein